MVEGAKRYTYIILKEMEDNIGDAEILRNCIKQINGKQFLNGHISLLGNLLRF